MSVVVITGGSAGAGKAISVRFAQAGYDVAVIARDDEGLQETCEECEKYGVKTLGISVDVSKANATHDAAEMIESRLGAIDVWVNSAMTTVLSPFREITPAEFQRVTEVTYLGFVNGTRAALAMMAPRDRGIIIQVGSALAYRSIPLQSVYCGAKAAIRGFTDAVRTELMHEHSKVHITMVQMPGMNTPQFGWSRNKMDAAMQPVPPVYQPEVAAEAVFSVVKRPVRELWVGKSTVQSIVGQFFFPRWLDRLMVKKAWEGQLTDDPSPHDSADILYTPRRGNHPTHGEFSEGAKTRAFTLSSDFPGKLAAGAALTTLALVIGLIARRKKR